MMMGIKIVIRRVLFYVCDNDTVAVHAQGINSKLTEFLIQISAFRVVMIGLHIVIAFIHLIWTVDEQAIHFVVGFVSLSQLLMILHNTALMNSMFSGQ